MTPSYWNDASRELSDRDPVLRVLIRNLKGAHLQSRSDAFTTLARSIVGQQIAEAWQPWRTVATWYLWRSLDPIPVEY